MTSRACGYILLFTALLVLAVSPAIATPADTSVPAPLAAAALPNLMQENSKLQYTWSDFRDDGNRAQQNGNYEEAVKYYNKAEEMLVSSDPGRSSSTEYSLGQLEQSKGMAYGNWDGHEAESDAAFQKSAELSASAQQKAKAEGKGCLIVTATFGSPLAAEVQLVRSFRDDSITKSYTGSRFMPGFNAWYYSFSPQVSAYIGEHPIVKPAMQILITPLLEIVLLAQICWTFLSFNPELATIGAIIVGSTLYGIVYVFPAVFAGIWIARKRGWKGAALRHIRPAAIAWGLILVLMLAGLSFSLDALTTAASGLFVIATILLVVAALSVVLSPYIGRQDVPARD